MIRYLVLAIFLSGGVASAQEKQVSFAAAIAPEQAFEVCFKEDAISAAQCALDKCRASAGEGADCVITSACGGGWAGSMGITTGEVHWTETVCGAPDQAAVVASLKAFCKSSSKFAQECYLASVWSEEGKEKKIDKALDPKKLK